MNDFCHITLVFGVRGKAFVNQLLFKSSASTYEVLKMANK